MASDVMNSASIHNEEKDFYRDAMTKRVTRYQEGKDIAHSYHDIANNGNKEAFIKYYTDNKVNESEYFSEYPDIDPELALVSPTVIGPLGLALTNKAVQHLVDGNILPMSELKKMNPAQQMAIANAWVTGHINNHTFTFDQVINAHIDVLQALVTEEGQRFIDKNLEILTNKQHFPDGMLAVADLIKVTSNHENGGWQMSYSSGESTSSTQSTNRTLHINSRVKELCLGQNNQSPSTNETMPEEKENCAIQ